MGRGDQMKAAIKDPTQSEDLVSLHCLMRNIRNIARMLRKTEKMLVAVIEGTFGGYLKNILRIFE